MKDRDFKKVDIGMVHIQQPQKKDSLFRRVVRFFRRFFIVMGMAATAVIVLLSMASYKVAPYVPAAMPDRIILSYTFKSGLMEKVTMPSLTQPLLRPATTFHEVTDALTQAAKDSRVKGFVARIQDIDMSPAQIQELRDTITRFRTTGKFAYVFSEEYGGFSSGMGSYYLAAAFDQIWLQPVGSVSMNGVAAEVPFLREIMDKVGVEAQFARKGLYKSAAESLTEEGMSASHREMMTGLVNDLAMQMVYGIAENRKIPADTVRRIIDDAPYGDIEATKLNLVDKIGYYNQMVDEAKLTAGSSDVRTVDLSGYSYWSDTFGQSGKMQGFIGKSFRKPASSGAHEDKVKIALIFGVGDIVSYSSQARAGLSGFGMAADNVVAAFEEAQNDKDVAAVVFRIDSPGGAPEAAESIRRAIIETQQRGKPVIVSMGGYAASGGYWVATPAKVIVAEPATITGSIGVFGGKFVLAQMWKKLGVNWEGVQFGDNARMWSSNVSFSNKEKERIGGMLNGLYEAFVVRVMEGRKMTREQVISVAEGRIWTGKQAKENGLVDELGGLDKAIIFARVEANLKPDQDVLVEVFPAAKSTLEMFIDLATEGVSVVPDISITAGDILRGLRAEISPEAQSLKAPRFLLH
ncbi:MAG: signal peptide peptidase SppA [Pseudomonadota bacterium]